MGASIVLDHSFCSLGVGWGLVGLGCGHGAHFSFFPIDMFGWRGMRVDAIVRVAWQMAGQRLD